MNNEEYYQDHVCDEHCEEEIDRAWAAMYVPMSDMEFKDAFMALLMYEATQDQKKPQRGASFET